MSEKIIQFPKGLTATLPKTPYQQQFELVAQLLQARALRNGGECSIDRAKAALTQAILAN